jgi:hypothetical protein
MRERLVANTKYALRLFADERKLTSREEGIESGSGNGRFFLDRILASWSRPPLASLELLSRGEHDLEVNCKDLSSNDGLRTKGFGEIAKDLL